MSINLSEPETRLWAAASALRGTVDPAYFKTHVFPLLFGEWISDTWTWERERVIAEYGLDVHSEVEAHFHRFLVDDVVRDIDTIVKQVSHSGWAANQSGSRTVNKKLRAVLKKRRLPLTGDL